MQRDGEFSSVASLHLKRVESPDWIKMRWILAIFALLSFHLTNVVSETTAATTAATTDGTASVTGSSATKESESTTVKIDVDASQNPAPPSIVDFIPLAISSITSAGKNTGSNKCGLFEEYSDCTSACPPSCVPTGKMCVMMCVKGCKCIHGFVRNHFNRCIPPVFCSFEILMHQVEKLFAAKGR